VILYVTTLFKY